MHRTSFSDLNLTELFRKSGFDVDAKGRVRTVPVVTEIQTFLKSYSSQFGKSVQTWFSNFDTLAKAWDACEDASVMIRMLQCKVEKSHNYETGLLIFSANLLNAITDWLIESRRLVCELSSVFALTLCENSHEVLKVCAEIQRKYPEVLRLPMNLLDRDAANQCYTIAGLLSKKTARITIANSVQEWFSRACIHVRMITDMPAKTIKPHNELRLLVGNPFEVYGNDPSRETKKRRGGTV